MCGSLTCLNHYYSVSGWLSFSLVFQSFSGIERSNEKWVPFINSNQIYQLFWPIFLLQGLSLRWDLYLEYRCILHSQGFQSLSINHPQDDQRRVQSSYICQVDVFWTMILFLCKLNISFSLEDYLVLKVKIIKLNREEISRCNIKINVSILRIFINPHIDPQTNIFRLKLVNLAFKFIN